MECNNVRVAVLHQQSQFLIKMHTLHLGVNDLRVHVLHRRTVHLLQLAPPSVCAVLVVKSI